MKRRDFIRITAAGSALLGGAGILEACGRGAESQKDPMQALFGSGPMDPLKVAESTAAWLRYHTIDTRSGYTWPTVPAESDAASVNLYSGTPGIILLKLEGIRFLQGRRLGFRCPIGSQAPVVSCPLGWMMVKSQLVSLGNQGIGNAHSVPE